MSGTDRRVIALDVLRGIAVLGMLFSGIVPWEGLPGWMYHCQEPPPSHAHNPLNFGITWVDLVFPVFLFCLGAAIPLALSPKVARGVPVESLLWRALLRYLKLAWFAVFTWQTRPWELSSTPGLREWGIALVGLVCVLGMFAVLPSSRITTLIRIIGWGGSWLLLTYFGKAPSKLGDTDYIILILGMCSFGGAALWMLTREAWRTRLVPLALLVALKVGVEFKVPLAETIYKFDPLPNIYGGNLLPYLIIVLLATFVGDWLLHSEEFKPDRLAAWIGVSTVVAVTIGLYSRWLIPTALFTIVVTAIVVLRKADRISLFGHAMVLTGLATEWIGGGIRKDPNTVSYFFVGAGVASLLLSALMHLRRPEAKPLRGIVVCGENPLLAYALITHFAAGAWALTIGPLLNGVMVGPYLGLVRALIQTAVFVGWVWLFRRAGIRLNA